MCAKRSLPRVPGRPLGPARPLSPSKPGGPGKPVKKSPTVLVCGTSGTCFFFAVSTLFTGTQEVSLTFGSGTSGTAGQTGRPVHSRLSRVAGLALGPGETGGACGGDEGKALLSECLTPGGKTKRPRLTSYSRTPSLAGTSLRSRETGTSRKAAVAGGAVAAAAP